MDTTLWRPKFFETKDAVENGASEIDMVINLGWVKDRNWKDLAQEIAGGQGRLPGPPPEGHH